MRSLFTLKTNIYLEKVKSTSKLHFSVLNQFLKIFQLWTFEKLCFQMESFHANDQISNIRTCWVMILRERQGFGQWIGKKKLRESEKDNEKGAEEIKISQVDPDVVVRPMRAANYSRKQFWLSLCRPFVLCCQTIELNKEEKKKTNWHCLYMIIFFFICRLLLLLMMKLLLLFFCCTGRLLRLAVLSGGCNQLWRTSLKKEMQ